MSQAGENSCLAIFFMCKMEFEIHKNILLFKESVIAFVGNMCTINSSVNYELCSGLELEYNL